RNSSYPLDCIWLATAFSRPLAVRMANHWLVTPQICIFLRIAHSRSGYRSNPDALPPFQTHCPLFFVSFCYSLGNSKYVICSVSCCFFPVKILNRTNRNCMSCRAQCWPVRAHFWGAALHRCGGKGRSSRRDKR